MVQAPDISMVHPDFPQALVLLSEMNGSAQHVASLVDNMLQRVRDGELSTDQGLSFLEMKYHMLLSYLINLTYVILRKCSAEKIEGDPCIDRLVEIRTVLEKIRPIDKKLKYQIDKLVKEAVTGSGGDDSMPFKADISNMARDGEESGSDDDDSDAEKNEKGNNNKSGVYVPPKISAVHYTGDETAQERNKRQQERNKKHALSSAIMDDLREEYLDTPLEVSQGSRANQIISKKQQQIQEYEEEYMTRLPVKKADKQMNNKLSMMSNLGDEVTDFGSSGSSSKKRKRPTKSKGKNFKRKRWQ